MTTTTKATVDITTYIDKDLTLLYDLLNSQPNNDGLYYMLAHKAVDAALYTTGNPEHQWNAAFAAINKALQLQPENLGYKALLFVMLQHRPQLFQAESRALLCPKVPVDIQPATIANAIVLMAGTLSFSDQEALELRLKATRVARQQQSSNKQS